VAAATGPLPSSWSSFSKFAPDIATLPAFGLSTRKQLPQRLRLFKEGELEAWYTPFDHINRSAKLVLVGITPGETQLLNGLAVARSQIAAGAMAEQALTATKHAGAFSGSLRQHLVALLDSVGIQRWLRVASAADLFEGSRELLHTTSVLRHAVFYKGKNYNGTPSMLRNGILLQHIYDHLVPEIACLDQAVFLPLGGKVATVLNFLTGQGVLAHERVLPSLPHPSPANIERIQCFLGLKQPHHVSPKTDARKLLTARETLTRKLELLAST
jgi:hypothetical protein